MSDSLQSMDYIARQASLSVTNSQSLLKFIFIKLAMPPNHLILCYSFPFLPSVFPSIRVFSNESALRIRCKKIWSFSFSPSSEYSGLISFKIEWFDLHAVQGDLVKTMTSGLTRSFRYDLNQIPYNYTVDVTN